MSCVAILAQAGDREDPHMDIPAGEFNMEIATDEWTPTEQIAEDDPNAWTPTVVPEPSVEEISDESEMEVEILAIKPPPKLLKASEEVLRMKEEERYGYLYRVQDRQAAEDAKRKKRQEEMANRTPEERKAIRKSIRNAIMGYDL